MRTAITGPNDLEGVVQLLGEEIQRRHRSHLRDLRIEVVEGGVILHGRAVTFYGKQIAFHEVSRRLAVVANRIEVQARPRAAR